MKVILLVSKLSGGGAERVASELSLNLPDDIERTLILLEDRIDYPYDGKIIFLKTRPVSKYNIPGRVFNIASRIWQFRKIIRTEKPDWVIAFSPALCLLSSLVFKNTIARANNLHSLTEGYLVQKLRLKVAYNKAKKVTAISYGVKDDLQKNFGIKKEIEVLHNPIDLNVLEKNTDRDLDPLFKIWAKEGIPIIITAGRLIELKGHWHLIRAFSKVREDKICRLVILGQGYFEEKLKTLSKELGVEENVHFAGFQSNPYAYFSQANIFVFSSLYEGFGKVVVEAMACGLPVISSDCRSGPREILAPDTNFLKEAEDIEYSKYGVLTPVPDGKWRRVDEPLTYEEEKLAEAIGRLLCDENMREDYKQKSLERVKDFCVEDWIERWLNVLEYEKRK